MKRRNVATVALVVTIVSALFTLTCVSDLADAFTQHAKINLSLFWLNKGASVLPAGVVTVRVKIRSSSPELPDTMISTIDWASKTGRIDGIPVGIPISVVVEAMNGSSDAIFSGSDSILTTQEKTVLKVSLNKLAPPIPTALSFVIGTGNSVELTWNYLSTIADSFIIERRVAGGQYGRIGSLLAGIHGFVDSTITNAGLGYEYHVYAVNDAGNSPYATATVAVADFHHVNQVPQISSMGSQAVAPLGTLTFKISAIDPDGDSLVYSMSDTLTKKGAILNSKTGDFRWTPQIRDTGSYSVSFFVTDTRSLPCSVSTIIVVNADAHPPVFDSLPLPGPVAENTTLSFHVHATDSHNDKLTYSVQSLPQMVGAVIDTAGLITWTPTFNQAGSYVLTIRVTDGNYSAAKVVTIVVTNVNRSPKFSGIGPKQIPVDSLLSFTVLAVDPDGDNVDYSVRPVPANATFDTITGIFSWRPGTAQKGNTSITFFASDRLLRDSLNVTVNVGSTNHAPVLDAVSNQNVNEGTSLQFAIRATDSDSDRITYHMISNPPVTGARLDSLTGAYSWQPTFKQAGTYSITFSATDAKASDEKIISVIVKNVNLPPVLDSIPTPQSVLTGAELPIQLNSTDPDSGSILKYSMVSLPVLSGAVLDSSSGLFRWTPATGTPEGSYVITVKVSDGALFDSQNVVIGVTAACLRSTKPKISVSGLLFCSGSAVTLSLSQGTLGTTANWAWFKDNYSGSQVDSGRTITLRPLASTTYYVKNINGKCDTTFWDSVTLTAATPSVAPTGLSASPATLVCASQPCTLTVSGGSLGTNASWRWYQNASLTSVAIGNTLVNGAFVVNPASTTTYYVRAEGGPCGNTAEKSVLVTVRPDPLVPTILGAMPSETSITITWKPVANATSYYLYHHSGVTFVKGIAQKTPAISDTTFTISGLIPNSNYVIALSASTPCFETAVSASWSGKTSIVTPKNLVLLPGSRYLYAKWDTVASAKSYNVYYQAGTSVTKSDLKIIGASRRASCAISPLTNNTIYAVAVATVDSNDVEGPLCSYKTETPLATAGNVTDVVGNLYHTVAIGTQVWMVENLKTTKFRDGTPIPRGTTAPGDWGGTANPKFCWYNDDSATYNTPYGLLYNGFAAQSAKLAPDGWHVPTSFDWDILFNKLGGQSVAGGYLKERLETHWSAPNTGATDDYGFSMVPGGGRSSSGTFSNISVKAEYWSNYYFVNVDQLSTIYVYYSAIGFGNGNDNRNAGFSIRCVRD